MDIFSPILTNREKEIATLVARGLSNDNIASYFFISKRTVEDYVYKIYSAVNVKNRAGLIFVYLNNPSFFELNKELEILPLQSKAKLVPLSNSESQLISILAKNSLSIRGVGTSALNLSKDMGLTYKQVGSHLQRLSRRRLIFCHLATRTRKEWYPAVVGLALLRSSR